MYRKKAQEAAEAKYHKDKQGKTRRSRRALAIWSAIFVLALLSVSVSYALLRPKPPVVHQQRAVKAAAYKPVVGDVQASDNDSDPDVTVQQALIPTFQFKNGGYTLSGSVTDAHTGKVVIDAVVWIDLPVQTGQPTSNPLHTVTDASGHYQFMHLAQGIYTIVASRYNNVGDGRNYAERVFPSFALGGNRSGVVLPLVALAAPSKRSVVSGQAKNLILIDLRGFYAASLLDDPLLLNQTRNLRSFLQRGSVASAVWLPYGWRPLDQYALLTGSYPQWNTYDPWPHPVPWGMPDKVDTTFWFTGGRSAHLFGQQSIFDVAKSYGMQTGVVAGTDYILSDTTTRSLDLLQRSSSFSTSQWLTQMEEAVLAGEEQMNGSLLYGELAPLPASDDNASPDAEGDTYQQSLLLADQSFGQFLNWLAQQGLQKNTLIALTTSQAQANHTDADNFYGMGSNGQGSSKQTLLALVGPGVCAGTVNSSDYPDFIVASALMHAIGLPAPAEARVPALFSEGGCR